VGNGRTKLTSRSAIASVRRNIEVTLVISWCAEKLDWVNISMSKRHMIDMNLVIVRKCPSAPDVVVPHHRLWHDIQIVHVEDLPLRADECSAYMGYLAQKYEELPRHMIFVHADAPEHIGLDRPNILDDTIKALLHGTSIPFAHLGMNRVTMSWDPIIMGPLWRGLFGSTFIPGPTDVKTYCCSHFVVSRERVWLRPRRFYSDALRFLTSPASYAYLPTGDGFAASYDLKCRAACQHMMFLWHVVFGDPLDQPYRMFDPHLPMFMKVRNIRMAYMDME